MEFKYLLGLGLYFILLILIGLWVKGKINTAEDYLVGGRSFNTFFNTATLTSCFLGGSVIVAVPGATYELGIWNDQALWGSLVNLGGGTVCLFIAGLFFMPQLWRLKLLSLGDFYYKRYGRATGILATFLISFTFIFWISVQVLVFAKIAGSILDWPFMLSIIISVTVICVYTMLGGLWAVCMTDVLQVSLVLIGLSILTPLTLDAVGGWESFIAAIPQEKTQFFPAEHSPKVWLAWIAAWVMLGFGSIATPDLTQRSFSAKSAKVARRSAFIAGTITVIALVVVTYLTYAGSILIDKGVIPGDAVARDPELILPVLFKSILPTGLVVLFLGACLAAVMSAADSALLALSGMVSKNIVKDLIKPDLGNEGLMQATRLLVLIASIAGAVIAVALPNALTLVALAFDLITCCLFGPLVLGLYWKKANGYGTIAGMLVAVLIRVVISGIQYGFTLEGIAFTGEYWFVYTLISPIACVLTIAAVSLMTQKANPPIALNTYD